MKKIITNSLIVLSLLLIVLVSTLSTIGIETTKFNKIIKNTVSKTNNINLELNKIKFKVDLKKLSLFLETQNPKIIYKNIVIPVQNVRVYVDFISLLKSDPKVKKTNLVKRIRYYSAK